ncbi:MAG: hypothetical protein ABI812_07305 [Betaproteobacteria bacterium]
MTPLDRRCVLALAALQLAVVAVVMPRGNFPLADDWTYAHSVLALRDEHAIRLSSWVLPNILPQTLLGGLATALWGFSSRCCATSRRSSPSPPASPPTHGSGSPD